MRSDAPVVWYCVLISEVLSTVLVAFLIRVRPSTDNVTPPVKRRSVLAGGADDEEDDVAELGGGLGGGVCCASG